MSEAGGGDDEEEVRRKLHELQKYVPFMKNLIENAEKTQTSSPSVKQKMKHLLHVLQSTDKLPKLNLLLKCEVLLADLKTSNLGKRAETSGEKSRSKGKKHSSSSQPADSDGYSGKTSSGSKSKSNDSKERRDETKNKKDDRSEGRGSGKSSQSSRLPRRSPSSSDSGSDHRRRRSSSRRRYKSHKHSRRERSSSSESSHSGRESRRHRKSDDKRRYSPTTIDISNSPESPRPSTSRRGESPDIIIDLDKTSKDRGRIRQKSNLIRMGSPKSPSPSPASPEPEERSDPKLIPLEPQMSILDLPMPPTGDEDCELEVVGATPKDPRPNKSSLILKSRANLRLFTQKLMDRQMSGSSAISPSSASSSVPMTVPSVIKPYTSATGSHSNTSSISSNTSELSTGQSVRDYDRVTLNYTGPAKTIDYEHGQVSRPTSAGTSTPSYDENPYSPINIDVQLDPHLDDDIDEEMEQDEAPLTSDQLPPPNLPPPSFDLPNRPTTDILSSDDIASLTAGITSLPTHSKSNMSHLKSKTHDGRSVPKINDFIPARGVIGRVPSHLMASKGATPKVTIPKPVPKPATVTRDPRMSSDPRGLQDTRTSTDIRCPPDLRTSTDLRGQPDQRISSDPRGQPDQRISSDPRGQPDPRKLADSRGQTDPRMPFDQRGHPIPRKEGDPRMQQAGKLPSPTHHFPGVNRPIPEPLVSPPLASNKPVWGVSSYQQNNPMPPSPRPLISPPPPFSPPSPSIGLPPIVTPAGIPINKGNPIPVLGGPYQSRFNAPHMGGSSMGPRMGHHMGPHYMGGPRMGGPRQNYPHNYMNHNTPRTYAEHRAARQRAEEDEKRRKAEEEKRAKEAEKRALAAKNLASRPGLPSTSALLNRSVPFRPPMKKPLTKLIDAQPLVPPVKPNTPKSKVKADEKAKTDDKLKSDIKKPDDKSKPKASKPQERRTSSEKKEEKSHERRLSSDRKEERRSSTEEKHVDKSIEKISPLDSLYGEMPGPKVGFGYGVQKFRIPRKPKPKEPTPPPKEASPEPMEEDEYEDFTADVDIPSPDSDNEVSQDILISEDISEPIPEPTKTETKQPEENKSGRSTRSRTKTSESDVASPLEVKSMEDGNTSQVKPIPSVAPVESPVAVQPQVQPVMPPTVDSAMVEEFTRQQIETVVNKLFASEDAEKILNARLLDVFKKLKPDNYEKIKRLLNEEESNSASEEEVEVKKKSPRAKKKVQKTPSPKKSPPKPKSKKKIETPIYSETDTSDEEPLARKVVKTRKLDSESDGTEKTPEKQLKEDLPVKEKVEEKTEEKEIEEKIEEKEVEEKSEEKEAEVKPAPKEVKNKRVTRNSQKSEKQEPLPDKIQKNEKISEEITESKNSDDAVEEQSTTTEELVDEKITEKEEPKEDVAKKRRFRKTNELDRLHEDIRDMFICEGVLKASGPRNVKQVNYAISPEASALKALRKAKRASAEQSKLASLNDANIEEESKDMQPSTSKEDLPPVYVMLEKKDLSPYISRPTGTDDEISMDGSVTLSSGRSSHASTRNVARRGRRVANQGSRPIPTPPPESMDAEEETLEDDAAFTDMNVVDTESPEMDAASEAGTETSENLAVTSKPGRGRGRGRGRKTKWQQGKPTKYNKKHIPVKKLTTYQLRPDEDLSNPHYYLENCNNPIIRCLICVYEGKKIVDHYLDYHPDVEVLFSRLAPAEMKHALKQPENCPPPAEVMNCRFCNKEYLSIEDLYDHVTEHTGEYRYKCPVCPNYIKFQSKTVTYHVKNCHPELESYQPLILREGPHCEDTNLPGYICGFCRFVQFDRETVEKHIERRHRKEKGATIPPGLEEINVINMAKWCQSREEELVDSPMRPNLVLKTEVDNDAQVPHTPAELPTLNFSASSEDPENLGIKLEVASPGKEKPNNFTPEEEKDQEIAKQEKEEESNQPPEDLSSLDLQITLSTLQGLLTETTKNNPKSLLETIRSQRYESMEGDDNLQEPSMSPTRSEEPVSKTCEVKSKLPIPSTSTIEEPTEESTSSSEDEIEPNKSESIRPSSNLLRPGLIDKLKSSIESSSITLQQDNTEDTSPLQNDEDSNASLLQGPSIETEPTRKRKLSGKISCYACEVTTDTISELMNHIEGHSFELSGYCPMCDFPIGNTKKALTHLQYDHAEKRASLAPEVPTTSQEEQNEVPSRPLIRIKPLNELLASDGSTDSTGNIDQQSMAQPAPQSEPPNLMAQPVMMSDKSKTFATLPAGSRVTIGPRKQAASSATPPPRSRTPSPPPTSTQPPMSRGPAPKHAPSPIYVKDVKSATVYTKMMIPTNLRNAYKCMDSTCSFSTDNDKKFTKHIKGHESIAKDNPLRFVDPSGKKRNGWRQCAYCSVDASSTEFVPAGKLVQHYKQCHRNCVFQCAFCFYRSASKSNVLLHETQSHGPLRPKIYMCSDSEPSIEATLPDQTKLLGNLVMPYRCKQGTCTRQFYNQAKFVQHMNIEHKASKVFKCHVCDTSYISPQVLLDHYKIHAYAEFQCMICRHGTDAQDDMHRHLYIEHPNYTACLLVRSMIGSKSQRNVLQGALRRLEMSNITTEYIAADEDESEEEVDDLPPTLHIPSPEHSSTSDDPPIMISSVQSAVSSDVPSSGSDYANDDDMDYDDESGERTRKQSSTNRDDQDQEQEDLDGHDLYICSNQGCRSSFENTEDFSDHLMVCDMTRTSSTISCFHCQRTFRHISGLTEHLRNIHGPKRFTCGLCKEVEIRTSSLPFMYRHFRQKHKTVSTLLKPVDHLKNNQETDKFIVIQKPISPTKNVNNKKSKLNVYSPSEIEQLPKQPIFQTPVQCSECNFTDRVRTNMIRHLKSHIEDGKEITKVIPINPMPCLESKERFFDKMTNWAGSSHRNPDGSLKPSRRQSILELSDAEKEKLPVFIPTSARYVCGALNCAYLTTDSDMLRLHVMNLHSGETIFNCLHCPNQDWLLTADAGPFLEKALSHIKMHGEKLYRCPYCSYFHSQKKNVERHMTDKHKDITEVKEIMIIREPEMPEQEPPKNNTLIPTVHQWLCSECGHKSLIHEDMKNHCKNEHGIKSQYRCSICTTRASSITTMNLHFTSKHPLENILFYASYYRSDFSDSKVMTGVPTVESREPIKAVPTPSFVPTLETVRTIRQIVIEEVEGIKSQKATTPQKVPTPTTPPKATATMTTTVKAPVPAKIVKNTIQNMQETTASKHTEKKRQINMDTDEYGDLLTMFGPLGYPQGSNYFCPICHRFKTKSRLSFKDHLYREFKYKRFMCRECRVLAVDKSNLLKHIHRVHTVPQSNANSFITVNPHSNPQLEVWTNKVLQTQASLLTPDTVDLASEDASTPEPTDEILEESPEEVSNQTPTKQMIVDPVSSPETTTTGSPLKSQAGVSVFTRSVLKPRPVENAGEPKPPEKDPLAMEELQQSQENKFESDHEVEDDDYDDDCPLVIDEPEEKSKSAAKRKSEEASTHHTSGELLKDAFHVNHPKTKLAKRGVGPIDCKHCHVKFKQTRGLKMHIKLHHFRLGAFLCGHCNISTNSELITQKHCRSAHPGKPESVIRNTEAAKMALDDDFWEREYGIPKGPAGMMVQDTKTSSSSELIEEPVVNKNNSSVDIKCKHCDYSTNSRTMLKQHEKRHWVQKPFRCGNCEFEGLREYDIKKHSLRMHPNDHVSIVEKPMPSEPDIQPLKRARLEISPAKSDVSKGSKDSNNSVADASSEADILTIDDDEEEDNTDKNSMLFKCFYCPLKALKLPDVHQHWAAVHKVSAIAKTGTLPFRYKSIPMTEFLNKGNQNELKNPSQKVKCAYCQYSGTVRILKIHIETDHPNEEFKVLRLPNKRSLYKCKHCTFEVHSRPTLKRHHESKHPQLEFGYTINGKSPVKSKPRVIPTPKVSKYLCCWCKETCDSKEKMEYHNKFFHSHLEPSFQEIPQSISITTNVPPADEQISIIPHTSPRASSSYSLSSPSYSSADITIQPVVASTSSASTGRKNYICPECPEKTKTYRGMEEHIRNLHVSIYRCKECNYVLQDEKAVNMHMFVEHPTVVLSNPLQKCESKVNEIMKFVKKEGYEDEHNNSNEKIPEFSEISITDILNKNTPVIINPLTDKTKSIVQKVRCVAKKSTTRSIPKNTARKSFPSVVYMPYELSDESSDTDYSDVSSDEEDEGYSVYVPPSERLPQIPLSQMANIKSKMPFGISSIPMTVDKMSQILNLEVKLKMNDCKNLIVNNEK